MIVHKSYSRVCVKVAYHWSCNCCPLPVVLHSGSQRYKPASLRSQLQTQQVQVAAMGHSICEQTNANATNNMLLLWWQFMQAHQPLHQLHVLSLEKACGVWLHSTPVQQHSHSQ